MLYQIDRTGDRAEDVFGPFWQAQPASDDLRSFAERLVRGTMEHREELDRAIGATAQRWRMERMAVVDRNILRLAAYELLHDPATPPAVVIDEAVRVAQRFGSAESGKFINGILDELRSRAQRTHPPAEGGA